jgi:CHRD domain
METNMMSSNLRRAAVATLLAASFGLANAADVPVVLTGDQEVPTVSTAAKGTGKITIAADKSVSGTITTTGITGTIAHIHEGAPGKNGPPIITLEKGADSSWSVPSGSKLTDAQYKSFKAGNLYVNVHSEEHKSGEIRAQLKP